MNNININSYKISNNIHLDYIIDYFNIKMANRWVDYIVLSKDEISLILNYDFDYKKIYINKYGIITFINFNQIEIRYVIKYLRDIYINIDYSLFESYKEMQTLLVQDNYFVLQEDNKFKLEYSEQNINLLVYVLAKSLEMNTIEEEINLLLDQAEKYINFMKQGKINLNIKKIANLNTKIIKFNFKKIYSLGIYSKPIETKHSHGLKEVYNQIHKYFEIEERLSIIESKIEELTDISDTYINLSFSRKNAKRDVFEIVLLSMFPLFRVFSVLINMLLK